MAWGYDGLKLTRVCPICGKTFIPGSEHVYRDKSDPYKHLVCSYPCMRESERRQEERRAKMVRRRKRKQKEDGET